MDVNMEGVREAAEKFGYKLVPQEDVRQSVITLRISSELHARIQAASRDGKVSMNRWISDIVISRLEDLRLQQRVRQIETEALNKMADSLKDA